MVVLFLNLVGWTRLAEQADPEPLQALLEQYYEICSAAVDEHGGEVEKFIGDAIMAVFGAATSQEDDAPRALRAAARIRSEVVGLVAPWSGGAGPVEVHCGIAAGEALVTCSPRAGLRVVGDVVNLAARLQSMAPAGQILVNETAAHLAGQSFVMEPTAPLTVKGKAEPVQAFLMTGQAAPGAGHAADALPLVDRDAERDRLREAFGRVTREQRAETVAVLGASGIGKTRLVLETTRELGEPGSGSGPVVVFGDCPSYGANGNYAALVQVLDALTGPGLPGADLIAADGRVAAALAHLRSADGGGSVNGDGAGPGVEEVSWAVRELLAAVATARPLVVVWDSLECAGYALLRLIGELALSLRHVPMLMICAARPELAEHDLPWLRDLRDRDVIEVRPLTLADSAQLATAHLAGGQLITAEVQAHDMGCVEQVALYSAGNPLFIRLLLESVLAGLPLDDVPPTIVAMVGATIDRLPPQARQLLGAASVIGPVFTVEQLGFLGEPVPDGGIDTLVDRHLIHATARPGEYGFVQQPVHEVAYGRLDKERRCTWHQRLAEHGVSPAFHLEAAVRLLRDLRPHDTELIRLAHQAAEALLREGTAALRQRDLPTAVGLLDRALTIAPGGALVPGDPGFPGDRDWYRSVAAIRLSDALLLSGDTQRAVDLVTQLLRDDPGDLPCQVQRQLLAARRGAVSDATMRDLLAALDREPNDGLAWCRFEQLRMHLHLCAGRFGAAEQAVCAALGHARGIGDAYEEDRLLAALCEVRQWSPTPITEKLASCAELTQRFAADRFLLLPVLAARARCLALTGERAGARAALAEASTAVSELRLTMGQVLIDQAAGLACSLDGEHGEAQAHYRRAADALEQAGHAPVALTMRVQAARERAWGQLAPSAAREIAALLARREQMDVRGRVLCTVVAVRLGVAGVGVAEVLALLADIDDPCLRGDVYFDLAQAHRRIGGHADATAMARAAIDGYATVGATRPIRLVRAWM